MWQPTATPPIWTLGGDSAYIVIAANGKVSNLTDAPKIEPGYRCLLQLIVSPFELLIFLTYVSHIYMFLLRQVEWKLPTVGAAVNCMDVNPLGNSFACAAGTEYVCYDATPLYDTTAVEVHTYYAVYVFCY